MRECYGLLVQRVLMCQWGELLRCGELLLPCLLGRSQPLEPGRPLPPDARSATPALIPASARAPVSGARPPPASLPRGSPRRSPSARPLLLASRHAAPGTATPPRGAAQQPVRWSPLRISILWPSLIYFSEQGESSRGVGAVSCQGVSVSPWNPAAMKIKKANAGSLTNFEVLDFLRSKGAKIDPMGCLGAVAASECKVYEYLLKTPACNQTRESIYEFMKRSEGFKLADADKLNVINWRPSSAADVYAMIEECGKRFNKDEEGLTCNEEERVEEFLDMVKEVLPPPPPKAEAEEEEEGEAEEAETKGEAEEAGAEVEAEAMQE